MEKPFEEISGKSCQQSFVRVQWKIRRKILFRLKNDLVFLSGNCAKFFSSMAKFFSNLFSKLDLECPDKFVILRRLQKQEKIQVFRGFQQLFSGVCLLF